MGIRWAVSVMVICSRSFPQAYEEIKVSFSETVWRTTVLVIYVDYLVYALPLVLKAGKLKYILSIE